VDGHLGVIDVGVPPGLRRDGATAGDAATFLAGQSLASRDPLPCISSVVRLRAPTTPATVTVAQQAPVGTSAWPGGKPGEWSYRLTNPYGWSMEWVVRGNTVEDCFDCTPRSGVVARGPYPGDAGSNGYTIATEPYLPGTAYTSSPWPSTADSRTPPR